MRTLKMLKPGQRATKDLLARYGASLLFVLYRCDEDTGERLKTVELVVQRRCLKREAEWPGSGRLSVQAEGAARRRVAVRIGWRERDLQGRVKSARSWWDLVRRVWVLRRDVTERLDLLHRVAGGGS